MKTLIALVTGLLMSSVAYALPDVTVINNTGQEVMIDYCYSTPVSGSYRCTILQTQKIAAGQSFTASSQTGQEFSITNARYNAPTPYIKPFSACRTDLTQDMTILILTTGQQGNISCAASSSNQ